MGAGIGGAIAGLLVRFGGQFLTQILDLFTVSAWRKVAAWTTLTALVIALYSAITLLISGIYHAMPEYIQTAASWVIPDNANTCLTVYLAGTTAITLFRWKKRGIQLALGF